MLLEYYLTEKVQIIILIVDVNPLNLCCKGKQNYFRSSQRLEMYVLVNSIKCIDNFI